MAEQEKNVSLNIGLFGPPGSGKGTQAATLIEEFGFTHLAPGDLLRQEIREKTPLGLQAEEVMRAGKLVSDEIIHGMVGNFMASVLERQGRILLDGFPRTTGQLEFLEDFLKGHGAQLNGVFFLDIPTEKLIARLTGRRICPSCNAVFHVQSMPPKQDGICDACGTELIQRKDDNRESIEGRLTAYEQQTYPILKAFEAQGKLFRVNGDQAREAVYGEIASKVRQLLQESVPTPNA